MLASVDTDFDQPIFTDYAHINQPIDTNADPFVARDQFAVEMTGVKMNEHPQAPRLRRHRPQKRTQFCLSCSSVLCSSLVRNFPVRQRPPDLRR
jgi:hypothetical protein